MGCTQWEDGTIHPGPALVDVLSEKMAPSIQAWRWWDVVSVKSVEVHPLKTSWPSVLPYITTKQPHRANVLLIILTNTYDALQFLALYRNCLAYKSNYIFFWSLQPV